MPHQSDKKFNHQPDNSLLYQSDNNVFNKSDKKMIKNAGTVGILMVISRILGFIRDSIVAMLLGAGIYSDAFFAAFRIPDLFRKFFSDGALSVSFIPVFTEVLTQRGAEDAFDMSRSAWVLISLAGLVALFFFMLLAEFVFPESDLTIRLAKIMMPYLIAISLMSICMGILNSMGDFAAPAAAPILLNITIIIFAVIFSPFFHQPAVVIAWGVTTGGALQLAIQIPFIIRKGFRFRGRLILFHPDTMRALKMMLPALVGIAPCQINMLVATFMASSITSSFAHGSVSYLYYADRLVQFPLALFTVSVSTSIFPALSRDVATYDIARASELLARGVRIVIVMILPSMAGLAVLREPIVALLFYQGAFGINDVSATSKVLLCLSTGMWAFSGTRIFVSIFYALSNVKIPLIGGIISICSNIVLSSALMKILGVYGLALSISISSALNLIFLLMYLETLKINFSWRKTFYTALSSLLLSTVMYAAVYMAAQYLCPVEIFADKSQLLLGVVACVLLGAAVYGGSGLILKVPEHRLLWNLCFENVFNRHKSL